jgi:hypothetical protein
VKPFFNNSTPVMGSSTESNTQSLEFPLMAVIGIAGREREREKERERETCTQQLKQSLSDYAQQD